MTEALGTRDPQTWHPAPRKPDFVLPPGAVDAHCHVFGPGDQFPFAPQRKYTPQDAPAQMLLDLHAHLGVSRRVLVQASCHGTDNRAMVAMLRDHPETTRGVAVVAPDIADADLAELHAAGVRGIRFNFLKRLVDPGPLAPRAALARRVASLGWHVVVYFEAADLDELTPFLRDLPCPVVIDHMGRPDVAKGVDGPGFTRLTRLLEDQKFTVKVGCPERLTLDGPPYHDVVPFSRRLVERFPQQVLWGTDWPHPNMKSHLPDDGLLVELIPEIAPSPAAQRALLIDTPNRLYWSEASAAPT